jgi:hypothetical protein
MQRRLTVSVIVALIVTVNAGTTAINAQTPLQI